MTSPSGKGLHCRSISKSYGGNLILSDINFSLQRGDVKAIIGPSGSGKTTLLRILGLLESPDSGSVSLDSSVYRAMPVGRGSAWRQNARFRSSVTLVFQQLFLWPNLTCRENLAISGSIDRVTLEYAERLKISNLFARYPNQISLGQKQRVAFLRALITKPEFLLLDEVTSALDPELRKIVSEMISELAGSGVGVVLISHDQRFLDIAHDDRLEIAAL